jgi:phage antirepressor YoqD-like protein
MKENDIESGDRAVRVRFGEPPETGWTAPSRKTMTTKEVAEALGVSIETVRSNGKALFPDLFENGKTTYLNEVQTTAVKLRIAGHHNLHSALEVKTAQTRLERNMVVLEAIKILQEDNEGLRKENDTLRVENTEKAERLSIAEPKAEALDKITATESDISVRELAAILAVPHLGQNNLFQKLREDGYIDGLNRPYRQYVEAGLLYEKEYYVPQLDATKQQLRITQKGVTYFAEKYASSRTPQKVTGMSELRLSREATT